MNISARLTGSPAVPHFSQNSRSRSGSDVPSSPRRTSQAARRSVSTGYHGPYISIAMQFCSTVVWSARRAKRQPSGPRLR